VNPLVVLNIVGLTPSLIGRDTPHLNALIRDGFLAPLEPVLPAVTCPVQSSMLTGLPPSGHGVVANGWYFRDLAEVLFWRQSNHLVQGEKVWEAARRRDPSFTCAQLFWWFNMYASCDWSVTPRPAYPADGRKIPDLYTDPPELRRELVDRLGMFPLFDFWGPRAGICSSEWIAEAALYIMERHRPTLTLVYLPHLDYNLQRLGPSDPRIRQDVVEIDRVAGRLIEKARGEGMGVVVLSEYGITPVREAVPINRVLREAGYLSVHEKAHGELLDAGASRAFAVADHQAAHVYVRDPADVRPVRERLERTEGIDRVLDEEGKRSLGLDHPRSGELVALAAPDRWFSYPYWLDDRRAPDFARTVDIHRKPGYDPVELFLDPDRPFIKGRILWRLAQKSLGFRYLMDVISLRTDLVKGSHGRLPAREEEGPVFIGSSNQVRRDRVRAVDVKGLILDLLFNFNTR
jgi:predicted AlkP superfamily pyrophosphatase or phosphodiesterase